MKQNQNGQKRRNRPRYVPKNTNQHDQSHYDDKDYYLDKIQFRGDHQRGQYGNISTNDKKKYVAKESYKAETQNSSKQIKKQDYHTHNNQQKFQYRNQKQNPSNIQSKKHFSNKQYYINNIKEMNQKPRKNYNQVNLKNTQKEKYDNTAQNQKMPQNKQFPLSKRTYRAREPQERPTSSRVISQIKPQVKHEKLTIEQINRPEYKRQKKQDSELQSSKQQNNQRITQKQSKRNQRNFRQPRNDRRKQIKKQQDLNFLQEKYQTQKDFEGVLYQKNKIQLQLIGLQEKSKKLKKIFLQEYPNVKNLKIYVSKECPVLYFQYFEPNSNKNMKKNFSRVLRDSKKMKQKRTLFQQIFQRAFLKVDKKYYSISVFLIEIAKIRNYNLTKKSIFDLNQGNDVMFYYMKGNEDNINFVVFDCFMRNIQASSKDIQNMCRKHPDEFKIYLNFKKKITEHEQLSQVVDLLDKEQAESDEDQRPNFEQRSIQELKTELYRIADKNIQEIEKNIELLNNQLLKEAQIDTNSNNYKILQEKIDDLQSGYDMFIETRNQFLDQLNKNVDSKEFHKRYLKKMIIAEKQLESGLPIIGKKRIILEMLRKKNLLIIEGETGSGKSTQLPQILCEFYQLFDKPNSKPVLVTQPRRLATRSLAQRVAKQMGEVVGGFVDYVASAGKKVSNEAKIIFKLDRIMLDQLTQDPVLSNYSCLVIDQAHQRTISIDVILGLIKKLLDKRKDFKIIVTSASMDIHLFQNYFKTKTLKVSGRMYPVTILNKDYKNFYEGDKFQNVKKIQRVINQEILSASGDSMKNEYKGHLLCFCSQIQEINKLVQIYEKKLNKRMFQVFALHGKVTPGQQKKVFQQLGKHKFIFANRIAQTAITIDGVKVVIDPGNDVQLVYDQKYKYSSMKLQEITKSSAKQRAGRAGRTGLGYCFRLYSEANFNARPINKVPQIQNSSLETVVLRLKSLKIKDVINFQYISPPCKEGLQTSVKLLTLIGALNPYTEQVTKIGCLLIKIPIQPFLSRAIVESLMFERFMKTWISIRYLKLSEEEQAVLNKRGLTKTIISILALVINFSNLFFIKKDEREEGQKNKFYEFSDQEGDFFFLQNIFLKFLELKQRGYNKSQKDSNYKNKQLSNWIRDNYLNFKTLNQTEELIKQISTIISDFEFNPTDYQDQMDKVKSKLKQCKSYREVVLSCLITSFSANICKFSKNNHLGYTMVSQRKPIRIYGTSNLQLLGKQPQWIVCYDLYTNQTGRLFCKLANQVTYQFMKTHLDTFVWQLFDIQGIQKKSPFYKQLFYQFPTLFISKFKQDYKKSQKDERLAFLKDSYPEIVQQQGRITFFLQLGQVAKTNKRIENEFDEALQKYQITIINQNMNQYRHNYIGNVYVTLFDGFEVEKIEFDNREFLLQVTGETSVIQQMASDCQYYGPFTIEQTDKNIDLRRQQSSGLVNYQNMKKLRLTIFSLAQKDQFEKYFLLWRSHGYNLSLKQTIVDRRRKIPKTKIYMNFFAGKSSDQKLYAHYEIADKEVYQAKDMTEFIRQGINKAQIQRTYRPKLKAREVQTTRKGNGINIYTKCDQYQIAQQFFKMDKLGLFGTFFKMPKFIKKFREPEISFATKTNQEWKTQLSKLFEKCKIKQQNITINIRGRYRPDKQRNKGPLSEFEKSFRVDMIAQIITLDSLVLGKLKDRYDGKHNVLGCEKVHIRAQYDQFLGTASYKAFESLKDQYQLQVQRFKYEFPLLNFQTVVKMIRGQQKVIIYAHSPNREDFVKPLRIISNLFSPKLVKLTEAEFRFLDKVKDGSKILDQLQYNYAYKIYFGFERWTNTLKVYCHDNQIKDIQNEIKDQIAKYKYFSQKISYRGKNLYRVKQILDKYLENNPNTIMIYQIKFQFREVFVTGDLATVEFIKNQILKLVNSAKEECVICADIMKTPYKLIICGCSFCCMCLTQHIRAYRNSAGTELLFCPNFSCKKKLNIYDVKNLLSEQQFNKLCDLRINKYLQANRQKFIACNYCQNVFDKQQVEEAEEINCQICGRCECLKCKTSHPNYTCQEWKQRDILNLEKLGIRKCPNCNTGITKNGGCNHIECTICKSHICWKCMKVYLTSKECYDHLAKQCGGIFDPNAAY